MRKHIILYLLGILLLSVVACTQTSQATVSTQSTLSLVQERGVLITGVTTGVPGYSAPDSAGNWQGFDVDFARAVSAAIFGDPDKVEYRPLSAKERFTALSSGEIDILTRVTTWTATRDITLGLNFAGVNYYDGQGFLVSKASNITSLEELDGASISVQAGTTTELNLADAFRVRGIDYELLTFEDNAQAAAALESGRADAFTSDQSQVAALRSKLANPDDFVILPELISKEPLGPVVRQGDEQWLDIARWIYFALLNAEELGVNSGNVDEMRANSNDPNIRRLLGVESNIGEGLGLSNEWAYNVIKTVGNYSEIFDRHLAPLGLPRGINALWTDGGLQYGMPIR